jgi:hypothetical protein
MIRSAARPAVLVRIATLQSDNCSVYDLGPRDAAHASADLLVSTTSNFCNAERFITDRKSKTIAAIVSGTETRIVNNGGILSKIRAIRTATTAQAASLTEEQVSAFQTSPAWHVGQG